MVGFSFRLLKRQRGMASNPKHEVKENNTNVIITYD